VVVVAFRFSPSDIDALGLRDYLQWREQAELWIKARTEET
jgi:hypothetical protein